MSSDEREDFDVTEDDYLAAFGNRKFKKQSKNSRIYGIWADEEETGSDERAAFSSGRKNTKKDYTAPVSFVASGGTKVAPPVEDDRPVNSSDEDGPVLDPNDDIYERKYLKKEEDKPEVKAEVEPEKKTESKTEPRMMNGLIIGGATKAKGGYSMTPTAGKKEKQDKEFAKFARGGIAAKMMAKMGYKPGGGLGKYDQGMINPVDVKLRQRGAGLAFHGTERTKQSLIHFPTEEIKKKAEVAQKKKDAKGPQWKAQSVSARRVKPQYVYKTVDELIRTGGMGVTVSDGEDDDFDQRATATPTEMKIIDMTGKEQRVITDARQLPSQKPKRKQSKDSTGSGSSSDSSDSEDDIDKVWSCKELEHNLDTLCKNAERDILKREREKRDRDDQVYNLQFERKRNDEQIERDTNEIGNLKAVLELLDQDVNSLDEAVSVIALLQTDYPIQWKEFQLDSDMTENTVCPLLIRHLSSWNPLTDPTSCLKDVVRWRDLLPRFYQTILWHCWLPQVRAAIVRWEPRQPEKILEFVATWRSEVTTMIWENVMSQLIIPKVSNAVNSWDPYNETVRIDTWLLPWLPIIGKTNMNQMISQIRCQLKQCLKQWDASDESAGVILKPWKSVWSPAEWDQFMMQNIYPKLELHTNRIIINVESVNGKQIKYVQNWVNYVPTNALFKLFDEIFFPKWLAVLRTWLKSNTCTLSDVAQWYRAWYGYFVAEVRTNSIVRDRLSTALQMMNETCSERQRRMPVEAPPYLPPPPPPPSIRLHSDEEMESDDTPRPPPPRRSEPEFDPTRSRPKIEVMDGPPETFKDLIERRAQQRNILFMPKMKQHHATGKDLYVLGKLTLYIERGVCFVSDGAGDWLPTSVTKIFDKAK